MAYALRVFSFLFHAVFFIMRYLFYYSEQYLRERDEFSAMFP